MDISSEKNFRDQLPAALRLSTPRITRETALRPELTGM
jgi:hypothetical protein